MDLSDLPETVPLMVVELAKHWARGPHCTAPCSLHPMIGSVVALDLSKFGQLKIFTGLLLSVFRNHRSESTSIDFRITNTFSPVGGSQIQNQQVMKITGKCICKSLRDHPSISILFCVSVFMNN